MYKVSIDWHQRGCKVQAWVTERSLMFKRPPFAVSRHFVLLAGNDEDGPVGAVSGGGGRCDPETAQFEGKTCREAREPARSQAWGTFWIHFNLFSFFLKIYCGCMINRILGLKTLFLQVNCHAWFYLHVFRWPVRNADSVKNSKLKYIFQWDSKPRHANPRQESQLLRPLGHAGFISSGVFTV